MNDKLDYRYLRAFYLTAKYLNFSRAAEKLSIAQSAVSRQIKLLEESMGQQLIVRSSKKVLLTNAGKTMYRSIEQFEQMIAKITDNFGAQVIRIGILHGLLENWFLKVIEEFTRKTIHELKIEIDTPQNLKQHLLDGKLDLIITTENIQSELISSLRIFEEQLVIVSKNPIDLKKVHEYTWITYSENDFLFDLYKKHSNRVLTISSITTVLKLAEMGVGIAIVPSHMLKKNSPLQKYEVKVAGNPRIHVATHNFQAMPIHLEQLIEIITKSI